MGHDHELDPVPGPELEQQAGYVPKASICKVGRQEQVDLIAEGPEGLRKLAATADKMVTWNDGCTGCTLQKTCGTCVPLAALYRQANAPLQAYCQHGSSDPGPAEPTGRR